MAKRGVPVIDRKARRPKLHVSWVYVGCSPMIASGQRRPAGVSSLSGGLSTKKAMNVSSIG